MSKNFKQTRNKSIKQMLIVLIVAMFFVPMTICAEDGKTLVEGKVYKFGKDSNYEFSSAKKATVSGKADTYGEFSIKGDVSNISNVDGIPVYEVENENLEIFYSYSDTLLNAKETSWHLVEDKDKTIDDKKMEEKINKGTILLQTSKDRKNWVDVKCINNAFAEKSVRTESIYTTKDVQILNGCYYRVIVVYKMSKQEESSKILFVEKANYKYKKIAEVYEFYACSSSQDQEEKSEQSHTIGEKVRTNNFDGYSGEKEITKKKDAHYGWDLGEFFVSGYTDKVKNADGDMVFLKNVGDKVTLWFNLEQNIDALDGNKDLKITSDGEGYDEYFETPKMDFGRGTLIVRYTDYNGNKQKPQIYVNYLEANATLGADTKVQLFEEGDYEVALDYEVTNNKLIDSVGHYRIFFKFSVRNANCMVYPFDVINGNELTNSSMTSNGFRLDLAKSRYLKVNVKREMLTDSADGLVEDTRFNGPAKDGATYTDEGIYTITVQNEYTNQFTTKKIYVGENKILKAYMTTGLSIPEINNLVENGAEIDDDGVITMKSSSSSNKLLPGNVINDDEISNQVLVIGEGVVAVILVIFIILILSKKKREKRIENEA